MIAVQGIAGSFSEQAARQFEPGAALMACDSFDALFVAVASGRARCGVVPVRNVIAGLVADNLARVSTPAFRILGATTLPVQLALIGRALTPLDRVRRIASHPVALRQCTRFFADDPRRVPVPCADTGTAVRDLMDGALAVDAAIASPLAAAHHGAVVLVPRVDDDPQNATEFVLFAKAGVA